MHLPAACETPFNQRGRGAQLALLCAGSSLLGAQTGAGQGWPGHFKKIRIFKFEFSVLIILSVSFQGVNSWFTASKVPVPHAGCG